MKTQLISSMVSFTLGTGATIMALSSWLGTTDLQAIKESVVQLDSQAEGQALAYIDNYKVTVDNANAEIGEYKVALQQANDNISQLITAYNNAETEHQTEVSNLQKELTSANSKYETDMKELQEEYDKMVQKINLDYKLDMNEVVEKANEQINKANEEVGETKEYVDTVLENSRTNGKAQDRIAETGKVLDITKGEPVSKNNCQHNCDFISIPPKIGYLPGYGFTHGNYSL